MNNNNWIIPTYKPIFPNKTIKTFTKKKEDKYSDKEYRIQKLFDSIRINKFNSWIESPLKNKEMSNRGKYKGTYIYDDEDNIVLKKQFLSKFLHDLNLLLHKNGYSINNNKLFRDEVATFIYKLSK